MIKFEFIIECYVEVIGIDKFNVIVLERIYR